MNSSGSYEDFLQKNGSHQELSPFCSINCASVAYRVVGFLVCAIIVTVNVGTLHILVKTNSFRQSVPGRIMINLAMSDLMVGTLSFPFHFCGLQEYLQRYSLVCMICGVLFIGCLGVSILSLSYLSFDRQLAICYHLRYEDLFLTRHCNGLLLATWVVSIGLQSTNLTGGPTSVCVMPYGGCSINYSNPSLIPTHIVTGAIICLSIGLIQLSFHRIWCVAREMRKLHQMEFGKKSSSTWAITKTSFLIIGAFFLCWIPSSVHLVVVLSTGDEVQWFYDLSHLIITCNSFLNPMIYGYTNRSFKEALCQSRQKKRRIEAVSSIQCKCKTVSSEGGSDGAHKTAIVTDITVYTSDHSGHHQHISHISID